MLSATFDSEETLLLGRGVSSGPCILFVSRRRSPSPVGTWYGFPAQLPERALCLLVLDVRIIWLEGVMLRKVLLLRKGVLALGGV